MLRRLLLVLVTSGALLVAAGVGLLAADWPFLDRLWWGAPLPRVAIDGGGGAFFPPAADAARTLDAAALDAATREAGANGAVALLVLHHGHLQLERYWHGAGRDRLYPLASLSRTLLGVAYGRALDDGTVDSLDEPVERWLGEWQDQPRGRITLRQLLWNVSGLETPATGGGWSRLGKGGRLEFGASFARTALSFRPAHEAGTHFALARVDAQLAAIVLARASGMSYAEYIEHALWQPMHAGRAEFTADRRGGMAAAYDGLYASPADVLRLGALLAADRGWAGEMARGSIPNPRYGLQARLLGDDGLELAGDGRAVWVWPDVQLVVVRLGDATPGPDAGVLPGLLRRAVR